MSGFGGFGIILQVACKILDRRILAFSKARQCGNGVWFWGLGGSETKVCLWPGGVALGCVGVVGVLVVGVFDVLDVGGSFGFGLVDPKPQSKM